MFGKNKNKNMKAEEREVLNVLYTLLYDGKIPFKKIEPLIECYSMIINDEIERRKEDRRRSEIDNIKSYIKRHKDHINDIKHDIENANNEIAEYKDRIDSIRNNGLLSYSADYNIKDYLWFIYNIENNIKELNAKLNQEECLLKEAEDGLKRLLEGNK